MRPVQGTDVSDAQQLQGLLDLRANALRWSRARLPLIGTSTVTTRAVQPASCARRTKVEMISRLRHMYS